jgi:signal transduction histidine kinase
MRTGWLKPILFTIVLSFGLSALCAGIIGWFTQAKWHGFKLETLKRAALSLAVNANYAENLKKFGPIPEDGSSVFGRIWIVDSSGRVLISSSTNSIPEAVLKKGLAIPRTADFPIEEKAGASFSGERYYFLPMPGHSSDTLIIHDLSRGPGKIWLRTVILMLLLYSLLICFAVWGVFIWIFRRRSIEVRDMMTELFSGQPGARVQVDRMDRTFHLFQDINQMAVGVEGLFRGIRRMESARVGLLRQLAHDIRTPLTALGTATEALHASRGSLSPEDALQLSEIANSESLYLKRLVEELLYVAEQQESSGLMEQIDLVKETLDVVTQRRALRGGRIEYQVSKKGDGYPILIQRSAWLRVLSNLFDNSEKHGKGPIEVGIDSSKGCFLLTVRDHGDGIQESCLANYGIHQRGKESGDDSQFKSARLGAIIVRNLVMGAGGSLSVRNHPGGGLEIRIEFKKYD